MRLYYTCPTGKNQPMTRPDLSLGGFRSLTVCPNNSLSNLFADISTYSVSVDKEEFICLSLLNETGLDLKDVLLYFVYPTICQKRIEIAPVAFNINDEIEVVQSPYNSPYNATFYEADGEVNSINIGNIDAGKQIGLWFKKVIDKDAIKAEYSDDSLIANGTPVVSDEEISLMISWNHVPVLSTVAASAVTQTTVNSGGTVVSNGDSAITERGICWGTSVNPTIDDNKLIDAGITSSFVSNITGLTGNTTYYVRSYATNAYGTGYGNELTVLTSPVLSTITTNSATLITSTTVRSGGNVTNDGGADVTSKGVCWSTSAIPDVNDDTLVSASVGEGSFISNLTGLTPNTLYYLRAFSENSVGVSYGNEISFTTLT